MSLLNSIFTLSTTGPSLYTTSKTVDNDVFFTTIVSYAIAVAATNNTNNINIDINITNECISYLDTMPIQELTNGLDLLNQKEKMLELEQQKDNKLVKTLKKF